MPCIRSSTCTRPLLDGSSAWGLSGGVCQLHFDEARKQAQENGPANSSVPDDLLDDYARIYLLLERDKPKVQQYLRALSAELGNLEDRVGYVPKTKGPGHIKLSAALERYETYCWFPPCADTFLSQLPGEQFLSYLTRGLMAKDPGAGPTHGDFTHRIHWHVVSRAITDDFKTPKRAGWNHTPLKLFTYLGEPPAIASNLWTNLFEMGGESFRFPDTLNRHICNGDYGALSVNMARRFEKRSAAWAAELNRELYEGPTRGEYVERQVMEGGQLKTIEKSRKYWEHKDAIGRANATYAARKRQQYGLADEGPVMNRQGGPLAGDVQIATRIANSYARFNNVLPDAKLTYDRRIGVARLKFVSGMKMESALKMKSLADQLIG